MTDNSAPRDLSYQRGQISFPGGSRDLSNQWRINDHVTWHHRIWANKLPTAVRIWPLYGSCHWNVNCACGRFVRGRFDKRHKCQITSIGGLICCWCIAGLKVWILQARVWHHYVCNGYIYSRKSHNLDAYGTAPKLQFRPSVQEYVWAVKEQQVIKSPISTWIGWVLVTLL